MWERPGSLRTGSRPSVTQAGEGLDCNHVPLVTAANYAEVNGQVRVPTEQPTRSEERELSKHLAKLEYLRHRRNLRYQKRS